MNQLVFVSLFPVVLLIATGFIAGRAQWIRPDAIKDLSNLIFLLLTPALLFRTMSQVHVEALDFKPVLAYFLAVIILFGGTLLLQGFNRRAAVLALANTFSNTVMIGIAFSLVPAVIWPAVPYLVEPTRLGTAYGLMTMVQAMGLTAINLAAGALNDASGASADNPAGYTPMLWMFMILSLFGFVFAYALRAREVGPQGHGLESIKAGAPLTTP